MRIIICPVASRDVIDASEASRLQPLPHELVQKSKSRELDREKETPVMACAEAALPISVCPVCLDNFVDARVLPCLHSVCRTCVDKMDVTATDGHVVCPICRAHVCLPSDGGAAGLPKDVTMLPGCAGGGQSLELECALCTHDNHDGTKKKAKTWCKKCSMPLCNGHIGPHILTATTSGEVHHVIPLCLAVQESKSSAAAETLHPTDVVPMCPRHNEPLKFHCGSCDVAICGDCTAIGDHQGHKPVRYIRDIVEERKRQVAEKVDRLESEFTGKLERSLEAVDHVSAELARRADEVRTDIRQAGKRAVEMVEAHVEQMVQKVDDQEASRVKALDKQREELKGFLDSAKNAVVFKERIMQLNVGKEALFSLLQALETRTTSLLSTHVHEMPCRHSRMTFLPTSDMDLASKTEEAVGKISTCQASVKHTLIKGGASLSTEKGKTINVVIMAHDRDGQRLTTGDDVITAQCAGLDPEATSPSPTITDNNDGSYTLSVSSQSEGIFKFEVFVNGEKMENDLIITFEYPNRFDPNACHSSINISGDGKKATNTNNLIWKSVFGITPMIRGQFTWKMKGSGSHMIGVASKQTPTSHQYDYDSVAYCWRMNSGAYYRDGVEYSQSRVNSSEIDVIQVDLDCDRHTLQLTNLNSGQTSKMTNLPAKEYFSYVAMANARFVEFIE